MRIKNKILVRINSKKLKILKSKNGAPNGKVWTDAIDQTATWQVLNTDASGTLGAVDKKRSDR